jgi:hypothetical protein
MATLDEAIKVARAVITATAPEMAPPPELRALATSAFGRCALGLGA